MKNVALGVIVILVGIIATITVITITGTMNRDVEAEDSLQIAVKKSIENCTTKKSYDLKNNEQFIKDLLLELSTEIENDSDIQVDVMGINKDKGMLSIRVTEQYKSPTGQDKVIVVDTTAILDKGSTGDTINDTRIIFRDNDGTYLGEQSLQQGEAIKAPYIPSKAGQTFSGWIDSETNTNVGTTLGQAKDNKTFTASYT